MNFGELKTKFIQSMKKNVLSLMLLSFMAVSLFSCSKDDEDFDVQVGIIGKWRVESVERILDDKSVEDYAKTVSLSDEELSEIYFGDFKGRTDIEFQEGFVFLMKDGENETTEVWSNEDQSIYISDYASDSNSSPWEYWYHVKSLTEDRAVLMYDDGSQQYGEFYIKSKITLVKQP